MNSCLYFKILVFIEKYMCVIVCGKYYSLLLFKYFVFINYTYLFKTITMNANLLKSYFIHLLKYKNIHLYFIRFYNLLL